jgi:cytochrome c peroxidase
MLRRLAIAAFAMLAGPALPASAQTPDLAATLERPVTLEGLRWLPPGADVAASLSRLPARVLSAERAGGKLPPLAALGELAFEAPQVLGGLARKSGLSCQTCHTNGHINREFFIPGLSSRPGNVDVSSGLFNHAADDGVLNDLNIPSLRGVAQTAPFGHDGRFASLREFTRHVIVTEFRGPEPAPWLLDALVAYLQQLDVLPDETDRSVRAAIARGERLFNRPFPGRAQSSCAACHPADALFTDRRLHDVGTGGAFDTPSLRNVTASAPYFHDGRAGDLGAVIDHFDRHYGLGLSVGERADLLAYLRAAGGTAGTMVHSSLERDVARFAARLDLVADAIEREAPERLEFVVRALRHGLGEMHARLPGERLTTARELLVGWSRRLAEVSRALRQGGDAEARSRLAKLREHIDKERAVVLAAAPLSLYDPERLRQELGE